MSCVILCTVLGSSSGAQDLHSLSTFLWPLNPPVIAGTVLSCLCTMHLVLLCPWVHWSDTCSPGRSFPSSNHWVLLLSPGPDSCPVGLPTPAHRGQLLPLLRV